MLRFEDETEYRNCEMIHETSENINILHLPDEILRKILRGIKNDLIVAKTCKRFSEIIYSMKTFKMKLGNAKTPAEVFLSDEENLSSIINSSRRITSIVYQGGPSQDSQKFRKIIERHGTEVRELKIMNFRIDRDFFPALNSLPNVKRLLLDKVNCGDFFENFRLRLTNLRTLKVNNCQEGILDLFDLLSDDVLEDLFLNDVVPTTKSVHFSNQRKVKSVTTSDESFVNFNAMKLKRLVVQNPYSIAEIVEQQDELTYLQFSIDTGRLQNFQTVCRNLKSLETLKMTLKNPIDLSDLRRISSLKTFELNFIDLPPLYSIIMTLSACFRSIRSSNLQELSLTTKDEDIAERELVAISSNCPQIRKLTICRSRSTLVNFILSLFPKLEQLRYHTIDNDIFEEDHPNDFEHHNLKKLFISSNYDLSQIVKCPKLKVVVLSMEHIEDILTDFLEKQPSVGQVHLRGQLQLNSELAKTLTNHYSLDHITFCVDSEDHETITLLKTQISHYFGVCILRENRIALSRLLYGYYLHPDDV